MSLLDEIRAKCPPELLEQRDERAIAAHISGGRTRVESLTMSERGVRSSLSIVEGASFIRLLRELSQATEAPGWLLAVFGALKIPESVRWAYLDTLQCAYPWLQREGIDVGSETTRGMLDLIAAGNPPLATACQMIKGKAEVPDPVDSFAVRRAVWSAEGKWLP